jgi:hypothetical protein
MSRWYAVAFADVDSGLEHFLGSAYDAPTVRWVVSGARFFTSTKCV